MTPYRVLGSVVLAAAFVLAVGIPAAMAAPEVSSTELVEHPGEWDGKTVTFSGEVIGERMTRGSLTWLHINDDSYAQRTIPEGSTPSGYNTGQAVILPTTLTETISGYGDYDTRGDIVRITGVFHAADPAYGGDMTIEAHSLEVLERARSVKHDVPSSKIVWLTVLSIMTGASYVFHRRGERSRLR